MNRNVQNLGLQLEIGAIQTVITLMGRGNIFSRVKAELQRVEAAMPAATGHEKRAKFIAECEIIFTDLVQPLVEAELRILLEFGLKFLALVAADAMSSSLRE